jgi:hypothetical protein
MKKKIIEVLENTELKLLRKTTEMQKMHIKVQDKRIKSLEGMVTKLMKKQGNKRTEIFAALTLGEIIDNDIPTTKE